MKLPHQGHRDKQNNQERKLSEIIKEMVLRLLKNPDAIPSEPTAQAALMVVSAAWNSVVGDTILRDQHREFVEGVEGINIVG